MKYMSLDQRGRVQAEYIWIDAVGGTRSKTKVRSHPHDLHTLAGCVRAYRDDKPCARGFFLHATAIIRVT
jgi:hypothetical protein